jgi:hypothetical protein
MNQEEIQNALINYAFKNQNIDFKKCIAPEGLGTCFKETIRAHSIQNHQILDVLQRDGHVVMLKVTLDGPMSVRVGFEHVGRNKATTFTGLCHYHDSEIFKPIEEHPIDIDDEYHLFLLAYKAVTKQTYASINSAYQAELLTTKKKELGSLSNSKLTDEEKQVYLMSIDSHKTYLYKVEYDKAFLSQEYDKVCHDVIVFPNSSPKIAVNSLFTPRGNVQNESKIERIALNVFPRGNNTTVIFSYLRNDKVFVNPHIKEILGARDHDCRYLLSKFILQYCENFVLSPSHFEKITEDSRRAMIDFFISTITEDRLDFDDERLDLF